MQLAQKPRHLHERYQPIVTAGSATTAHEPAGHNAAIDQLLELAHHELRQCTTALLHLSHKSTKVAPDHLVQNTLLWSAAAIRYRRG